MLSKACILSFIILISFSCHNSKKEIPFEEHKTIQSIEESSIDSISGLYFNYRFTASVPLSCEDMHISIPSFNSEYRGVLDVQVKDTLILMQIKELLLSLQPSAENIPLDTRIALTLHYSNGQQEHVCIGGEYAGLIYRNGILQQDNNRLLYLLKNQIGYYPWMLGDGLFEMQELKDQSFMKDPFISGEYYKKWQHNLQAAK